MELSSGQLDTLRGLAGKKAGDPAGWTPIGAARELTQLGFAARDRSGWRITPSGEAALELHGAAAHDETFALLRFRRR